LHKRQNNVCQIAAQAAKAREIACSREVAAGFVCVA
jgi:hypothetical protein